MVGKRLIDWIKNGKDKGYEDNQLKDLLLKQGHNPKDVSEAIKIVSESRPIPKAAPKLAKKSTSKVKQEVAPKTKPEPASKVKPKTVPISVTDPTKKSIKPLLIIIISIVILFLITGGVLTFFYYGDEIKDLDFSSIFPKNNQPEPSICDPLVETCEPPVEDESDSIPASAPNGGFTPEE